MATEVYQEVFCRMVASAAFREHVVAQPDEALEGLDLSALERRRLLAIARQPGMRVNTAIHRANRLSPLDQTLPLTCRLLGTGLHAVLDCYWSEYPAENLQSPAECERFATFLKREMEAGRIAVPGLEEVLTFEQVCTELRFFSEEELRGRRPLADGLPSLVRIVAFRHNPVPLLATLADLDAEPAELEAGEFHLLIDYRSGEPDFSLLDADGLAAIRALASPAPTR